MPTADAGSGDPAYRADDRRAVGPVPSPYGLRSANAGQTRIVAEGERRLSGVEELEAGVDAELQRVARLRRSIPTEGLPCGVRPGPLPPFALMENRLFM